MRLLVRSTRDFMIAITVVLVLTGIGLYFILQAQLSEEMNEQLDFQADFAAKQLNANAPGLNPLLQINPLPADAEFFNSYGDTLLYDGVQNKQEGYRYLKTTKNIGGKICMVTVMTAHIGWDAYYQTIFFNQFAAFIMLGVFAVLVTYFSNRKLWKPFFHNLRQLKKHSVANFPSLQLQESNIHEFRELNTGLQELAGRAYAEYSTLREFTENASHEIQTPLGIAQSKLDRISQMNMTEEMAVQVFHAKEALGRLSRTNKNLLLLAKLDNYSDQCNSYAQLDKVIIQQQQMMDDLFATRGIVLTAHCEPVKVLADSYLCEILVSNVLSNMLRYTMAGGHARIDLAPGSVVFSNEGSQLNFSTEQLFSRFIKGNNDKDSTGLGLAIVKQICRVNHWQINYQHKEGFHEFTIKFQQKRL